MLGHRRVALLGHPAMLLALGRCLFTGRPAAGKSRRRRIQRQDRDQQPQYKGGEAAFHVNKTSIRPVDPVTPFVLEIVTMIVQDRSWTDSISGGTNTSASDG